MWLYDLCALFQTSELVILLLWTFMVVESIHMM